MAQHDGVIDNSNGLAVRTDMNAALAAIRSSNSGPVAPAVTVAGLTWFDTSTSPATLRIRNPANSAWVEVATSQPRFSASKLTQQYIPYNVLTKVVVDNVLRDDGGFYNVATSTYAPPSGNYFVTGMVCFPGDDLGIVSANLQLQLYRNGISIRRGINFPGAANLYAECKFAAIIPITAGDTLNLYAYQTGVVSPGMRVLPGGGGCLWSVHRIGG